MKKNNSILGRSGLLGLSLAVMATVFGVTSCKTDFDLDTKTPEWLGTSIFETLDQGFQAVNVDSITKTYKFKTYIRLIRDLGQEGILSRTGSRTMFVADDEAFERFFADCPFKKVDGTPVTCYDELSKAQKNMILKGSMLNNVYQVAMLSSTQGPVLGDCMRRLSTFSPYDSITIVRKNTINKAESLDSLPDTKYWQRFKTDGSWSNGMLLLKDGTTHSMIFFVNKFLQTKKIYDDDYDFLFNQGVHSKVGKPGRKPGDATVNGVRIEVQNKKCFNGFIHVMADVIYLLPSMAEYLEDDNVATIYSHILERFSAPYPSTYQRQQIVDRIGQGKIVLPDGVRTDTVFVKKYLSRWRSQSTESDALSGLLANNTTNPVLAPGVTNALLRLDEATLLLYDPGWNSYYSNTNSNEADVEIQRNIGVMFVPTDKALKAWWMSSAMRERYGWITKDDAQFDYHDVAIDMDSIPLNVIVKLINNNMQYSLTSTIPSQFSGVLNDARDPMFDGIDDPVGTFDSVVMCCNGAVYYTNTVYAPTSYRSVAYPALVNEGLQIINWAINDTELAYSAYLNSMVTSYSVFMPTVSESIDPEIKGKLIWIDPVSFALNKYGDQVNPEDDIMYAWVFSYNGSRVVADLYTYDYKTKTVMDKVGETVDDTGGDGGVIRNRLMELMDYHIVLGDVEPDAISTLVPDQNGYTYFKTKGNGEVRFKNAVTSVDDPEHPGQTMPNIAEMSVAGGYQIERDEEFAVTKRYDQYLMNGNGRVYLIDEPLMSSRRSVYDVLSDSITYPEFKSFYQLMKSLEMFGDSHNKHAIGSRQCVNSFNTYHYTVYVPSNAAIQALFDNGTYYSLAAIDSINNYCYQLRQDLINNDPLAGPLMWQDSLIDISRRLRHAAPGDTTDADRSFDYTKWVDAKKQDLRNFVNYHIQDNSVYQNAEFKVGKDEFGNVATSAKYETAFMNDGQYEKLTVSGGNNLSVKDANGNVRFIDKTKGNKYYNIMCREYEIDTKDSNSQTKVTSIRSSLIETSSFAVIHLIDGALCNGDIIF